MVKRSVRQPSRRRLVRALLPLLLATILVLPGRLAATAEPPSLLVLNLELVDTSGEVTDQTEEHERRLAAVRDILATELAAREVYHVVDPEKIQAEIDPPASASGCTPAMAARSASPARPAPTVC